LVAREVSLPQFIAEQDDMVAAEFFFFAGKQTS
jgi:hypothetical protein